MGYLIAPIRRRRRKSVRGGTFSIARNILGPDVTTYRAKGLAMNPIFDVFELQPDKRLIWLERFQAIDEAKEYAEKLHAASETRYVIYSVMERKLLQNLSASL